MRRASRLAARGDDVHSFAQFQYRILAAAYRFWPLPRTAGRRLPGHARM